jgi:hypothetical protein
MRIIHYIQRWNIHPEIEMLKQIQRPLKVAALVGVLSASAIGNAREDSATASMYRHYIKDQHSTLLCKCDIDPEIRDTVPGRCLADEPGVKISFIIQAATLDRWAKGMTPVNKARMISLMKRDPHLLFETTETASKVLAGTKSFSLLNEWSGKRLGGCPISIDNDAGSVLLPAPTLATFARSHLYAIAKYDVPVTDRERYRYLKWSELDQPTGQEIYHNLHAASWVGSWNEYIEPLPASMRKQPPLSPVARKNLNDIQLALDTLIPESPQ